VAAPVPRAELPVVYRRLFSDRVLDAGDLIVGREHEVSAVKLALEEGGRLRSAAVVGLRGSGTSAVAGAAARGWRGPVRRLDLTEPVTEDEVRGWFDKTQDGTLTVLSGLRWLYEMKPGGLVPLRAFCEELVQSSEVSPWLITADVEVWRYASRAGSLAHAMGDVIELEPLSVEDLASAVLGRHQMSGYELTFEAGEDLIWQFWNLVLRREEGEARRRTAWFHTLHEASGGVMHDALRLWMASIEEVDDKMGVVRVGVVPRPPVARINGLPMDALLTLVQVVRQGWISPDLHAALFRIDRGVSVAQLAALTHKGLLVRREDGRLEIARHLRNPVQRVLVGRGWS
jgi:hypothetical protein